MSPLQATSSTFMPYSVGLGILGTSRWVGALQDGPISVEMLIGFFVPRLIIFRFNWAWVYVKALYHVAWGIEMTLSSTNQNWSNYGFAKLSLRQGRLRMRNCD
jgi:hypothetical protein